MYSSKCDLCGVGSSQNPRRASWKIYLATVEYDTNKLAQY